jgi:hypothetical protein
MSRRLQRDLADFELAFARRAALAAVQSAEERERILAELRQAGELMSARVDAVEVLH